MKEKFLNIPTDLDTTIVFSSEMLFHDLDCVYQTWIYDGIKGSSLIFYQEDLQGVAPETIEGYIRASDLLVDRASSITCSKNSGSYAFFNFNFEG